MKPDELNLLLIQDSEARARKMSEAVRACPEFSARMTVATRLDTALDRLQAREFDLILVDLKLGQGLDIEVLKDLRQASRAAIITITEKIDGPSIRDSILAGAQDFLVRDEITPDAVERTILCALERNRIERRLESSQTLFTAFMDQMPGVVLIKDHQRRVKYVNAMAREKLGAERWLGQTVDSYLPPRQAAQVSTEEDLVLAEGPRVHESWRKIGDGSRRYFQAHRFPIKGAPREPLIGSISMDLTDHVAAEQALQESLDRLEFVVGQLPIVLWGVDRELKFTFSLGAGLEDLGLEPNQLVGTSLLDFLGSEEDDDLSLDFHRRALRGESFTYEYGTGGRVLDVRLAPLRDSSEKIEGAIGIALDTTAGKQAERELKESERLFRALTTNLPDIILRFDREYRHIYASRNVELIEGRPASEFIGKTHRELGVPAEHCDMIEAAIESVFETGRIFESEFVYDGPVREPMIFDWRLIPEFGEGNRVETVLSISRDITSRKASERTRTELEEQLFQSQKMEAVGTLAGSIAHDFNNLLHAISGYADLLLMARDEDDPDHEPLTQIRRATRTASELSRQLLTFSRELETNPQPLDLNREIDQARDLLGRSIPRMIELRVEPAEDLLTVSADPIQIEQVLVNLTLNARDAIPAEGRISVKTANLSPAEAIAETRLRLEPRWYVSLSFSDTGRGMDEETLARIFDPFYTTKEAGQGTGLGLSTVYGIIKAHGGEILAESRPGVGTEFLILLPAAKDQALDRAADRMPEEVPGGSLEGILVVDDESSIRDIASQLLDQFGYRTMTASTAEEALAKLAEPESGIDLILLDLSMPGMGGRRGLIEMRRLYPQVKVVIASGYASPALIDECLAAGALDFVAKPYRLTDLLERVRAALNTATQSPAD